MAIFSILYGYPFIFSYYDIFKFYIFTLLSCTLQDVFVSLAIKDEPLSQLECYLGMMRRVYGEPHPPFTLVFMPSQALWKIGLTYSFLSQSYYGTHVLYDLRGVCGLVNWWTGGLDGSAKARAWIAPRWRTKTLSRRL